MTTASRLAGAVAGPARRLAVRQGRLDTPPQHVVVEASSEAPYMVSPAAGSDRQPRRDEARGNPVRIRDCPAAVSGNDRRHTALAPSASWEATASRWSRPSVPGRARESEDLPAHRARPCAVVRGRVGRPTAGQRRAPWCAVARPSRRPAPPVPDPGPAREERAMTVTDTGRQHPAAQARTTDTPPPAYADAGAQAQRRHRARRRQQDRPRRRALGRRPRRRRPAARSPPGPSAACTTAPPPPSWTGCRSRRRPR